jgi:hypothetical protein
MFICIPYVSIILECASKAISAVPVSYRKPTLLLTVQPGKIIIGHRGKQKHLRKAEKDPLTFEN